MKNNEPLLEIRNLKKNYDVDDVLDGISLDIHKGEVVVVVGPSGCGKGIAFEEFLGTTFRGELGQFFTPRTIVDFMTES